MAKVAEVLVQTLVNAGVRRIYKVAGDSLNGMTETIRKSNQIEWLHVRHEEVAAFAAGAAHDYHGAGTGVQPLHASRCDEWPRRRDHRSR
jgi:thiamine pyrophosphate-dependent acetolactate synthase large subunit-like protein